MSVASLWRGGVAASLLLPIAAQASGQGLPVAAPQEIVAGAQSCAGATSEAGVDERKLEADGWRRATVTGKAADALTFYGKGKLLLTLSKPAPKVCIVTARIKEAETFGDIAFELEKATGTQGVAQPGEANTIYWFVPGHLFQLALTGKPDAPSVRVAVGYYAGEKK